MYFNFATVLTDAARVRPDKPYVITADGAAHTFGEIDRRAGVAAQVLHDRGVRPGAVVAIRLPNVVHFIPYYFAALRLGAVVLPLNPAASSREVNYATQDADAVAVITLASDELRVDFTAPVWTLDGLLDDERNETRSIEARAGLVTDAAVVLYTSGTTGDPKGVELAHLNLLITPLLNSVTNGTGEDDVMYAVLPFFHVYGLSDLINTSALFGKTLIVREKFSTTDCLDAIEQYQITSLSAVPTMLHALVNARLDGRDLTSVRAIASGGAPITREQIRRVKEVFPSATYMEGYGLTETGAAGTVNGGAVGGVGAEYRLGTVGRAMTGVEIRILDDDGAPLPPGADHVGEIVLRGPIIMRGYRNRPDETARTIRDGWFHTGDNGWLDEDGYLSIVGRRKELIIRGGFNVYPAEVESVLETHHAVSAAAVVGRPDEHYGEEVVAFVVLADPNVAFAADELIEYASHHLAPYKYPRHVIVKDTFPLGTTGKVDKRALALELTR